MNAVVTIRLLLAGALLFLASPLFAADEIVKVSGLKYTGTVIQETAETVTIRITVSGKSRDVAVPVKEIRRLTVNGQSRELGGQPAAGESKPAAKPQATKPAATGAAPSRSTSQTDGGNSRTKAEIDALVNKEGRAPPSWFAATPLNFPKTLQLNWPKMPTGGWNNQVNVGQYVWDVINPNESKWKEGVRLMHHLLQVNSKDKEVLERVYGTLGHLYGDCLQDYARAAFWWRLHGDSELDLARCYYKLGNRQMAVDILNDYGTDDTRNAFVIRLWAEMGDLDKALELADEKVRNGSADAAYLAQGDVHRLAGRYAEALKSYQNVLQVAAKDAGRDLQRNQNRARSSVEAIKVFEALDLGRIADGTYRNKALGYEADIEVEVTVKGAKIQQVRVVQHREKQYYSALNDTPRQIIEKQGVKGIDATASATITSEAIINATAKALAAATK